MIHQLAHTRSFAAGLLIFGLLLSGCSGSDETSTSADATDTTEAGTPLREVRVETMTLEETSFSDVIELTGTVEALNDASLSAQTSGTLVYRAELGATVSRNGLVAQIDSTLAHTALVQARAQLASAQAQYDLTEDTFKRQEPLYQDSIISATEYENVRAQRNQALAQLNSAEGAVAQAREQLANTRVRAPFTGTVEEYSVEVGEQVAPGAVVARMVSIDPVKVRAGVPERYARDVKVGSHVEISLDAYRGEKREGRITFVGNAINPDNRTFPVEIRLENTNRTLKPAMVARLYVTREELEDVLVIPLDAIPLDETGSSVFVVDRSGSVPIARRQPVTIGSSYAGKVVVKEGLQAGDEVVVLGQSNLTDGDAVQVIDRSPVAGLTPQ